MNSNSANKTEKEQSKSEETELLSEHQMISIDFSHDCPIEEKNEPETLKEAFSSPIKLQKKGLDDDEETFDTIYENLPSDIKLLKDCMYKAQGCCLLLVLKQFLKEVYTISERYFNIFIISIKK